MKRAPRIVLALTVITIGGTGANFGLEGGDNDSILVPGTVEATKADLGFQLSGRLEQVNVREGDEDEVRVRIVGDDEIDLKPGLPGDVTFTSADATTATATANLCASRGAVALGGTR